MTLPTKEASTLISSFDELTPITPQTPEERVQLDLHHGAVCWSLSISRADKARVYSHFMKFSASLSQEDRPEEFPTPLSLASAFITYLSSKDISRITTTAVIEGFENDFLEDTDVHTVALALDAPARIPFLRNYYSALGAVNRTGKQHRSALLASSKDKNSVYAICGGQGTSNLVCLKEIRNLYRIYGELIGELLDVASEILCALATSSEAAGYFEEYGFNVRAWVEDPEIAPEDHRIAAAPFSFPLIGLLTLCHFCVCCKVVGQLPGEVRDAFSGVTGHSQGVIAAAAIARSTSWPSFHDSSRLALEMLFWIGFECHHRMPFSPLPLETMKACIDAGEGAPSPMLSVRGLDRDDLQELVDSINTHVRQDEILYIALINARENMVVAGPPKTLHVLSLKLRKLRAKDGQDQSRVVFNQRMPVIRHQFLPMSSAFHCPYSHNATPYILRRLRSWAFKGSDLGVSVFHTQSGKDLRELGDDDIVAPLIEMVTADLVDWPKVARLPKATHIVDFGPGRVGAMTQKTTEGTGTRLILANEISPISSEIGGKSELFSTTLESAPPNWGELFRPNVTKDASGAAKLDTRMTRLLGVAPLMVAAMTPTTVPWDFVASITRAGYHVELAGGGYFTAGAMEEAIIKLSENIPPTSGITCNIIYANPKAVGWQIPLIQDLVRRGYPIDGLTIGAGVPSPEIVKGYIETMGLKHISFKPGSQDSIKQVIDIANAHPYFPIGLQWTGGRAGGHHSFEDFHSPMLETYGAIRKCDNIVLIAGSGFGGADDTYPYLTGEWARSHGYALMPFDGVLLGSRMMVAKEAHTSHQAKVLIAQAQGVADDQWHTSYEKATGGVITVKSEMGQPIHKLATRGVLLWAELDKKFFSISDRSKRLAEIKKHGSYLIDRLNKDFQKPWFSVDSRGVSVGLEDLTYYEVLQRLVRLMYVSNEQRWVDPSYKKFVSDFARRTRERLPCVSDYHDLPLDSPSVFLASMARSYPIAKSELLHPEDVSCFIGLCSRRGSKPVNFIPRLDDNFETWFKKDSLWQAEDVEAVCDQDAQRVCIIHGPVAAHYSRVPGEPSKVILDNISNSHVKMLQKDLDDKSPSIIVQGSPSMLRTAQVADAYVTENTVTRKSFEFPMTGELPDALAFQNDILGDLTGWARACVAETSVRQDQLRRPNPIRQSLVPTHGHTLTVEYDAERHVAAITMSLRSSQYSVPQRTLRISANKLGDKITAAISSPLSSKSPYATVSFTFNYSSEMTLNKLSEDMTGRNKRIKEYYAKLWLEKDVRDLESVGLHHTFTGETVCLTRELTKEFVRVVGSAATIRGYEEAPGELVPLDISIVIAWEALVKPLLTPTIDCDLLRLLHRSNEFKYVNNAEPLRVGDVLETSSQLKAVTIQNGNKVVEVVAEIKRDGVAVVEVTSKFFCQGNFTDYENTMSRISEPLYELEVASERTQALLQSREWLEILGDPSQLIGKKLLFDMTTQITYDHRGQYSSLHVMGSITTNTANKSEIVGKVYLERGDCRGNPVIDFLVRHGTQAHTPQILSNAGWNGVSSWNIIAPKANRAYGRVSKDTNPIHVNPVFAHYANLPGVVNHGMCTSAIVRKIVERAVAGADPARFRRYSASFDGMVFPSNELRISIQHVAMVEGRMILKIEAFNETTDEKVLEAEAEIEQASTAYLFTGQGSQEKGMGMSLYESSEAARGLWDSADRHLYELYGFSIIDIVRNDPKYLTVHFGGTRGRQIRDNFLAMTIERTKPDGTTYLEPIVKGLTATSTSYTFSDPRGLLYSTQFAQPALTLMEMATFVDMEARGLVQETASYAGHSLGEYSALSALARAIPMQELVSLVFYRGLTMQVAMERDEAGRTQFSMVAANPSRVSRGFTQEAFENVVAMIAKQTGVLLEIVNYNVQGRQYVCAGHLRALWCMTQVLNSLARNKSSKSLDPKELSRLVKRYEEESLDLAEPIELERGTATIPLRGIDVPFHSKYLRHGIPAYRKYLETKILEENIDIKRLETFIPNVTAKPFRVDRDYVEEAARVTNSDALRDLLDTWDD